MGSVFTCKDESRTRHNKVDVSGVLRCAQLTAILFSAFLYEVKQRTSCAKVMYVYVSFLPSFSTISINTQAVGQISALH
jgi:hypothetical protein